MFHDFTETWLRRQLAASSAHQAICNLWLIPTILMALFRKDWTQHDTTSNIVSYRILSYPSKMQGVWRVLQCLTCCPEILQDLWKLWRRPSLFLSMHSVGRLSEFWGVHDQKLKRFSFSTSVLRVLNTLKYIEHSPTHSNTFDISKCLVGWWLLDLDHRCARAECDEMWRMWGAITSR